MSDNRQNDTAERHDFGTSSNYVLIYTVGGFLFGLCFPLAAWSLDLMFTGSSWTLENIAQFHRGNFVHYIVDIAPFGLAGFYAVMGNMRAHAASRGSLLADVLTNMEGGVFTLSPEFTIVARNRRLFEMLGIPQEVGGMGENAEPIFRVMVERGDFGKGPVEDVLDEVVSSIKSITDRRTDTTSHEGRILETRYSRLSDGRLVGIVTDVTETHRIRKEIEAKNAILVTVLDSLDQGIVAFDGDLRMIAWNEKLKSIREYPSELVAEGVLFEKLMAHDIARHEFGPGDPEELLQNKIATAREFAPHAFERQRSDGTYLEVRGGPLPDGGFVSTFADITPRKEAEREIADKEALLRRAMENMSDGMYVLDANACFLAFNERYLELIDLPKGSIKIGDPNERVIRQLAENNYFGDVDVDQVVADRMALIKNDAYDEVEVSSPTGRIIQARKSPLENGGCVVTLTDISEHREAEDVLRNARDQAQALAEAKTQFVAVVSHEVRTPMNGVLGMARLLMDSNLASDHEESVRVIIAASESLVRILDDLLDLSKLEADKIEYDASPFLPTDVAEHAVALMTGMTRDKGLILQDRTDENVPPVLIGDAHRIRQVLVNLISNAVKFTAHGIVSLNIELVELDGDIAKVRFAVSDNGKGIAPETQEKLFSAYEQGGAQIARKYGGTGLGLTISRQLVEGMGGEIKVDSVLDQGSTFWFTLELPVDENADPAALRDTSGVAVERTNMRKSDRTLSILQVEDDDISRAVVEKTLGKVGHTVRSVADGVEALAILEKRNFDLILMDRHMPNMNGIETTRHIRQMKGLIADMPIIGITAGAREDELQECLDAGFNIVLTKPVDGRELCATIGRLAQSGSRAAVLAADHPILVVDDTPINLIVAEAQLGRLGLECHVVGSGAEALAAYGENDYAAVLVDIMMPEMGGIELTAAIRTMETDKDFERRPVIAMTGFVDGGEEEAFRAAGGDDFLVKPVVFEDLSASLAHWLHVAEFNAVEAASQINAGTGKPIDLGKLAGIIGTDEASSLDDVLRMLLDYLDPLSKSLRSAYDARDQAQLREAAHTAKGAAANAAAVTLHNQLKELETSSLAGDWAYLEIQIMSAEREFRRVESFIHETLS
ncbi:MAG: response regulator [Alphaproteobacteria bacterium]|jgi:signal transduction histidine kinase/DNA-binding response OmpR family regulator|nr:response regulator [Alphaproteobacteria bacterium]MBT4085866.1 response regulator [Alphaproteobacteria bacterium]MBT6387433.1 response regulator [Alphaproteobacteria bacterium]MBT7746963.1 response regulator [Alphaproteobacteria bacterium]